MTTTTAHRPHPASRATRDPYDLTPCQEQALDRVISDLRSGRINDVVVRHLEADGVWHLEPLLDLAGAAPCSD